MNTLTRREPAELVHSARTYADAAKADRTRGAYRLAWSGFEAWCSSHGLPALPASGPTVALYLTARADAGRKPATIALDLAAISESHRAAGVESPRKAAEVRAVLQGIRRTKGVAQRQVAPLLAGDVRALVRSLPSGLLGARDRALLLVGWAGAFRRSELVGLEVGDLRFVDEGLEVHLRRSKTDQEGAGRVVAIPRGSGDACPVRALRAWLDAAGVGEGLVFREVTRHGRVGASLSDRSVARIVKRACVAAGLEPERYSGHSLRAGLATAAAKAGKGTRAIMKQTGHRSEAMVRKYVRDADLWTDNAAAGLL